MQFWHGNVSCVLFPPRRLCLPKICLSVCLSSWKFYRVVSLYKEKLFKFWKSSASGSRSRNFLKNYTSLQDMAFFTLWLVSLKNWSNVCENITKDISLDKEVPVKFGGHPDVDSRSWLWIWTGSAYAARSALSEYCCSLWIYISQTVLAACRFVLSSHSFN